ncbi:hypothetical protein BOX15_Mlig019855g1, partial [Macrostomum lignano]
RGPPQLNNVSAFAANETCLCWCSPSDGQLKVHTHFLDRPHTPLQLIGHRRPIVCLALTNRVAPRLLASQAEDHVTLWDLDECADNDARGDPVEGRQRIATGARVANSLAFLSDARFLALVYTRRVLLLRLNSTVRDQDAAGIWLDGHSAQVNLAIDLPDDRLLTISDDRTFQLWRLGSGDDGIEDDEDKEGHHCAQLLHRSAVLGPAALTAAALAESDLLYLGSAAGRLTVVGLGDDGDYRELARSSLAAGQLEAAAAGSGPALSPESAAAVAALALTQSSNGFGLSWWCLLAVTALGVHLVNAASLQKLRFISFAEAVGSSGIRQFICERAVIVSSCTGLSRFSAQRHPENIDEAGDDTEDEVLRVFVADVKVVSSTDGGQVLSLSCCRSNEAVNGDSDLTTIGGFAATVPLNPESPLAVAMPERANASKGTNSTSGSAARARETIFSSKTYGGLNRRGKIDSSQSVTFRNKIKSSGYGAAAPRQPPSRRRQAPQKLPLSSPARSSGTGSLHRLLRLLQPNSAQQQPQAPSCIAVTIRPTDAGTSPPVTRLRLLPLCRSRDAGLLLCCAANGTAALFEGANPGSAAMRERRQGPQLAGASFGAPLVAGDCSLNGDKVLTASSDGACRVWSLATGRQLLELGDFRRASGQQPKCRPAELTHAQFYFLDKFLLLSQGNRIRLFACHLGDGSEKRDDVRTYSSAAGRCKEALSLSVPTASRSRPAAG